jgi:hypothetical protein
MLVIRYKVVLLPLFTSFLGMLPVNECLELFTMFGGLYSWLFLNQLWFVS